MSRYVRAMVVYGLRHPTDTTSTAPILWADGPLPSSLPAAFSGYTVLPWLDSDGFDTLSWTSDPRAPVGNGGRVTLRLVDDSSGSLGQLLLWTPKATFWDVEHTSRSTSDTSLTVTAKPGNSPTSGNVYW